MSLFEDKTERLERKVKNLEEKMNKVSSSMTALTHVITELSEERKDIRKERDSLVKANRKLLALVPEDRNKLSKDVFRNLLVPFLKNNTEAVKLSMNNNVSILFDEVIDKGHVDVSKISKKLNVHDAQIEEWGRFLEKNNMAKIKYHKGKAVIIEKAF